MITLKKSSMKYKSADGTMQDVGAILGKEVTDITLSKSGVAADSKAVGDKISKTAIFDPEDNEVIEDKSSGKFVLIESVETTEETTAFMRTEEPDGTPYDFKKLKVIIKQPKGSKKGVGGIRCIDVYNANWHITSATNAFHDVYWTFSQYNASIEDGILTGNATTIVAAQENINLDTYMKSGGYLNGAVYRNLFDICEVVRTDKIEFLRYSSLNGYPIPIGTKIDIYAVRSK